MFGSRRSKRDDKKGTRKGMQRALREEKFIPMPATDEILLAHLEEVPQLPSAGQPDSHSLAELTQRGHPWPFHT